MASWRGAGVLPACRQDACLTSRPVENRDKTERLMLPSMQALVPSDGRRANEMPTLDTRHPPLDSPASVLSSFNQL
jgi:hypothetical protein